MVREQAEVPEPDNRPPYPKKYGKYQAMLPGEVERYSLELAAYYARRYVPGRLFVLAEDYAGMPSGTKCVVSPKNSLQILLRWDAWASNGFGKQPHLGGVCLELDSILEYISG